MKGFDISKQPGFYQWELWKDCNNNCDYCFNKNIKKVRNKVESLKYVFASLGAKNIPAGSSVGFIGGEFFGGQLANTKVKKLFYEVMDLAFSKVKTDPPGRFLITVSLMAEDKSDLFEFLEFAHIKGMDDYILLCTSWDMKYRFSEKTRAIWEDTMRQVQEKYPAMDIHVEMILTETLIQGLLNDTFSIRDFEKKWGVRVDLNTPFVPWHHEKGENKEQILKRLPDFFPKRKSFLRLMAEKSNSINLKAMSDCRFRSSELHYTLDDYTWIILPERHKRGTPCTNLRMCDNCCGYADSEVKIQEDIKTYLASFA